MTNRDKNILAYICRHSNSLEEVKEKINKCGIDCTETTIKKYWKILKKEFNYEQQS